MNDSCRLYFETVGTRQSMMVVKLPSSYKMHIYITSKIQYILIIDSLLAHYETESSPSVPLGDRLMEITIAD